MCETQNYITDKKLTIVMPAYNEGEVIYNNLKTVSNEFSRFLCNYEIICVNDGSSDNTEEEITKATIEDSHIKLVTYSPNQGKGHAIKEGIMKSDGYYTGFLDSDLDLSPAHIEDFLKTMVEKDCDIVIGSKLHKESNINYPFVRKVMSYGYYMILVVLFHLDIKDTQTGVKLFKTDVIQPIIKDMQTSGFAFDIEILCMAHLFGYKIVERPVTLVFTRGGGEGGLSRIKFSHILKTFNDTLAVKKKLNKKKKELKALKGNNNK